MITIPSRQNRKWAVAHGQELQGDLTRTLNMDFNKDGYARIAPAPVVLETSTDSASFGNPVAVISGGTTYTVVTTAGAWSVTNGSAFTRLADSGNEPTIGVGGDAVRFNALDFVSGTTTLHTHDGSNWTSRVTGLSGSAPHPLCVFESRNEIAVGNANTVVTYNTSYSSQNTLTLPVEYTVVWMRWRQNFLYIGTRNVSGAGAKMFIWNGTGTSAQSAYGVQGSWIYSGIEFQSSIVVLTSTGQLLRFNGGGFDELAHFPVYDTPYSWLSPSAPSSAIGKCTNRGMAAKGDSLFINIDGSLSRNAPDYPGNYLPDQPSGLWQFIPGIGLHHKAGYKYTGRNKLTATAVAANVLTFGTNGHMAQTGDAVFADTISGLTGITASQTYFAIKVSETSISLALSPADAYAGRAITLGGSPTSDKIAFNVYNSVAALYDTTPGCVATFQNTPFYDFYGTSVMFGGKCLNGSNVSVSTFMSLGMGRSVASFVTRPLYSPNALDTFQKVFSKIGPLRLDSESVLIKYKTRETYGLPTPARFSDSGLATWITASSFSIDTLNKDFQSVAVGDEITVLSGAAAGRTAHVLTITVSPQAATTYIVTIDETFPNVVQGNLSEVLAEHWTKLATITNATDGNLDGALAQLVGQIGAWIEFKFELRGVNVPISLLQFTNTEHQAHQ